MANQNRLGRFRFQKRIKPWMNSSHQSQTVYSHGVPNLTPNGMTHTEYNTTGMYAPLASENNNSLIILEGSAAWDTNVAYNDWTSQATTISPFNSQISMASHFKQHAARTPRTPLKSQQNIRPCSSSYFRGARTPNHHPQPRLHSPNHQHTLCPYNSPTRLSSPCQLQHRKDIPSRGHQSQGTTPPKYSPYHFHSPSRLSPPYSGQTMIGTAISRHSVLPASSLSLPSNSTTKSMFPITNQQLTHNSSPLPSPDDIHSTPSSAECYYQNTRAYPSSHCPSNHSTSMPSSPVLSNKRRHLVIVDSDDEDSINTTTVDVPSPWLSKIRAQHENSVNKKKPSSKTCPRRVISLSSSDEEDFTCTMIVINDTPPPRSPVPSTPTVPSHDTTASPPPYPTSPLSSPVRPVRRHQLIVLDSDDDDTCTFSHQTAVEPSTNTIQAEHISGELDETERSSSHIPCQAQLDSHHVEESKNCQNTCSTKVSEIPNTVDSLCTEATDGLNNIDAQSETSTEISKSQKKSSDVVHFVNTASVDELATVRKCSKIKAVIIDNLRPFTTYENLVECFTTTKGLTMGIVKGCWDMMNTREMIHKLLIRCENISQKLEKVVGNLGSQTQLQPDEKDSEQPSLLSSIMSLKPYQLVGVRWLKTMYEQDVNGILADDMGMGKTVQAIAFLAYLIQMKPTRRPHLVVVPASVLANWEREFRCWTPTVSVAVYHGSISERMELRTRMLREKITDFDVLLTTYDGASRNKNDRSFFRKYHFEYAVFDEGHLLKNIGTNRHTQLVKIHAKGKILLTGTPVQNNLVELVSLLSFVMPNIFLGKSGDLSKLFKASSKNDGSAFELERIEQAKKIMQPFVLRRLKEDVLYQLPKKICKMQECEMIPDQAELYHEIKGRLQETLSQVKAFKVNKQQGLAHIMELRKIANHPLLLRHKYTDEILKTMAVKLCKKLPPIDQDKNMDKILEQLEVMNDFQLHQLCLSNSADIGEHKLYQSLVSDSCKLRYLDSLLSKFKLNGDRVVIFSQFKVMLDIIEEYLNEKNIIFSRLDGDTPVIERQHLIDAFNNCPDILVFLLTTRAGGLGINLETANKVVIHDIDYNPYNDKQAEDRCYRIGQKRDVEVIKLISRDTIEIDMYENAEYKLKLEQNVTTATKGKASKPTLKYIDSLLKTTLSKPDTSPQKQQPASNGRTQDSSYDWFPV